MCRELLKPFEFILKYIYIYTHFRVNLSITKEKQKTVIHSLRT